MQPRRAFALLALLLACGGQQSVRDDDLAVGKGVLTAPYVALFAGVTLPKFSGSELKPLGEPALVLVATQTEIRRHRRLAAGDTSAAKQLAAVTEGRVADPAALAAGVRAEWEDLRATQGWPRLILALDTRTPAGAVIAIYDAVRAAGIDSALLAVASDPPQGVPVAMDQKTPPTREMLRAHLLADGTFELEGTPMSPAKFHEVLDRQLEMRDKKVFHLRPHPGATYGELFPLLVKVVDDPGGGALLVAEFPEDAPPPPPPAASLPLPADGEIQPFSSVEGNAIYTPGFAADAAGVIKAPIRVVFCVEPSGKVERVEPDDSYKAGQFVAVSELVKKWRFKPAVAGAASRRVCVEHTLDPPAKK